VTFEPSGMSGYGLSPGGAAECQLLMREEWEKGGAMRRVRLLTERVVFECLEVKPCPGIHPHIAICLNARRASRVWLYTPIA